MNIKTLAAALAVIGREDATLESQATQVLRIVRTQKIENLKGWNGAVRAAYKANGWNGKPGKPKDAEKKERVPATVKQYVSLIRRAFGMKLLVASYTSFYALRQDIRKKAAKRQAANGQDTRPELAGVTLARPEQLTGAPFHDLAAIFNALDRKRQMAMVSALERVKRQFAMGAPQLVAENLPGLRKAA